MDINDLKINQTDYEGLDIAGLPDQVSGQAASLKQRFDALVKDLVVPRFNLLIDELATVMADFSTQVDFIKGLDSNNNGLIDRVESADYLTSTIIKKDTSSFTPSKVDAAIDVHTLSLTKGIYIYCILATWTKVDVATNVMVRNDYDKVPSKSYGYFPATAPIEPGLQSVSIINVADAADVKTQIWVGDSTSIKPYRIISQAIRIA